DSFGRSRPVQRPARDTSLTLLTSLLFFPKIVAGPLTRANEIVPQLERGAAPSVDTARRAFLLIVVGLLKKSIADQLAPGVDRFFSAASAHSTLDAWKAMLAYAAQIYADFAGYSDIAIGGALLFGISLPRNFRFPYCAESPVDFWSRWHITL